MLSHLPASESASQNTVIKSPKVCVGATNFYWRLKQTMRNIFVCWQSWFTIFQCELLKQHQGAQRLLWYKSYLLYETWIKTDIIYTIYICYLRLCLKTFQCPMKTARSSCWRHSTFIRLFLLDDTRRRNRLRRLSSKRNWSATLRWGF